MEWYGYSDLAGRRRFEERPAAGIPGRPNRVRVSDLIVFPGIRTHSSCRFPSDKADAGTLAQLGCVARFGDDLRDFNDTAALLDLTDLVITTDTSVAHLAGAMGKPVWILLSYNRDWRWLLDRDDSPWYPSARLFRQQQIGNWAEVIERVKRELRRAILSPS